MENLSQILERLNREHVEYVVVGGLAGVFHGVPLVALDRTQDKLALIHLRKIQERQRPG
jgi:hypothetical protein